MNSLDTLLMQLEELSARAVEQAGAGDLNGALESVRERGDAVARLQAEITAAGPVSYTEWNRLTVIHFQGNRIQKSLHAARTHLVAELMETAREQALLECVTGLVAEQAPRQLNESA